MVVDLPLFYVYFIYIINFILSNLLVKSKMLLREKILIQTILFLLWVGSINYSVIYYLGLHQKGELLAKTINLSINFVIFIIVSTFLFSHYKIHKKINLPKLQVFWLLIGVIMLMSIGSLVQLKFRDLIPSFLRFMNYFGIFVELEGLLPKSVIS